MRTTLLLLVVCATLAFSAVFQKPIHKLSSRQHKLKSNRHVFMTGRGPQRTSEAISDTQPIIDYYDNFYLTNISIGTPGQEFTVSIDTASSDLWVIDASCQTQACIGLPDYDGQNYTKNRFDSTQSETFTKTGRQFILYFGSEGSNTGYIGTDVIDLGYLVYETQDILFSTSIAPIYGNFPFDGVLGLAWPSLAYKNVVPVLQNLLPQLDRQVFTIWLDRHVTMAEDRLGGRITFGGYDSDNCDPFETYVTLSSKTYWQFPLDKFSFSFYSTSRTQQAISDTGNSFISGPTAAISAILSATSAVYDFTLGQYKLPCDGTYDDFQFIIGGIAYSVPSTEYLIDLNLGDGQCALTVSSFNGGGGFAPDWILGDTWIRTYCNIYDIENGQIGFSRAHHTEI